jgi:molybdopterin converting factor small subunit
VLTGNRQSKIDNAQSSVGRVRVRCLGVIGDWVGARRLELAGRCAGEVAEALLAAAAKPGELGNGDGGLRDGVEVLVNGRNVRFERGPATPVRAGDEVTVFLHASWVEVPFM